jgi:SAM-dependent methyltransferase
MWRNPDRRSFRYSKRTKEKTRTCNLTNCNANTINRCKEFELGRRYGQNFGNPAHIEPYHIPDIYHQAVSSGFEYSNILITPKADGIPKALEITFIDGGVLVLHVECVDNNYYTIDVLESSELDIRELTFDARLEYLAKITGIKTLHSIGMNYITDLIYGLHYLTDTTNPIILNNRVNLLVKPIFKIDLHPEIALDKFGELCSRLYNTYDTSDKLDRVYPNDGWIVYRRYSYIPLKIKPYSHLTLDVRYDGVDRDDGSDIWTVDLIPIEVRHRLQGINTDLLGNTKPVIDKIYRCNPPQFSQNLMFDWQWQVCSQRTDKVLPNRYYHAQSLMSRCNLELERMRGMVDCEDMLNRYNKSVGLHYYDAERMKRTTYQNIQSARTLKIIEFMLNYLDTINTIGDLHRVIDIGAGSCNMYNKIVQTVMDMFENRIYVEYYGLDDDPIILAKGADRKAGPIRVWGSMNGTTGIEEYYSNYFQKQFDYAIVTFVNSIHYADDLATLFRSVMRMVNNGYIMIFSMFSDLIDTKFDSKADLNLKIKSKGNNIYEFDYPWRNMPFTDRIYSTTQIEDVVKTIPGLKIDSITEDINDMIDPHLIDDVRHEMSFLEMHRVYILKIR